MFQKYKIIDANAKHSIFLQSVHLHSSKKVLIHKIMTTDSELLKNKLKSQISKPDSISITEYYQSQHALFVVLEDAYHLQQVIHNMGLQEVVALFLQLLQLSKQKIRVFHPQLFVQNGILKTYCLGGADENISNLYHPPQFQYRFVSTTQKQPSYVWNLGVAFLLLLVPEVHQDDYNRKYKATIQKLQSFCKPDSKLQPVYHLLKCMLKYPPSERISWSIAQHSLRIILEQQQLKKSNINSKCFLQQKKSSHQGHSLIKSLLNQKSLSRSKVNRVSFIYKSSSPHRKLKSSKSGISISTSLRYKQTKNQSLMKLETKNNFMPANYKYILQRKNRKEDKLTPAKSFLEMIQQRTKKSKQNHSFLIKNEIMVTPPNQKLSSMNVTQILQDQNYKQYQPSVASSTQSTKRNSFKRNNKTEQSQKSKISKQSLMSYLEVPRKVSSDLRQKRRNQIQRHLENQTKLSQNEQIKQIFDETDNVLQNVQKERIELFQEIQEYSESNKSSINSVLQQIQVNNVIQKYKNEIEAAKILSNNKLQSIKNFQKKQQDYVKLHSQNGSSLQSNYQTSVIDKIIKSKITKKQPIFIQQQSLVRNSQKLSSLKFSKSSYDEEFQQITQNFNVKQSSSILKQVSASKLLPPKAPQQKDYKKMMRAFNLLGEVVKHANVNLKTQRSKWMVQCFLIYKCYWSFRMLTVEQLKANKRGDNIQTLIKQNQNIALGFNSMFNVVERVASNQQIYKQNKDIINIMELIGEWKSRYLNVLFSFFNQMIDVINKQRIHLVSKGKFKILLKFVVLVGVAILIIDEYRTQNQDYAIVDTYMMISNRLSETEEEDIIPESFTQELSYRINKVMPKYN